MSNFMKMCPESPYTHHLYIMQSAFKFTNTWNFLVGSTIRKQDIKTIFPKPAAKNKQQIFRKLKKKKAVKTAANEMSKFWC